MTELVLKVRSLKDAILVAFDRGKYGLKNGV